MQAQAQALAPMLAEEQAVGVLSRAMLRQRLRHVASAASFAPVPV